MTIKCPKCGGAPCKVTGTVEYFCYACQTLIGVDIGKPNQSKKNKYGAHPRCEDGIHFASGLEADYYLELKLRLMAGDIAGYCRQPAFLIIPSDPAKDTRKCDYKADFIVFHNDGNYEIIDTKGMQTPVYKIKMKAMNEKYPKLTVKEVHKNE